MTREGSQGARRAPGMRACALALVVAFAGCGGGDGGSGGDGATGDGATDGGTRSPDGSRPPPDGARPERDVPPPPASCEAPIGPVDTSAPDHVVGDGTPGSCTEAALRAAVSAGGTIVFDCGEEPVTIALSEALEPPLDRDTVVDGGGRVTLDGAGRTRIFLWDHPDWMNNENKLVLQGLTLRGGRAPRGELFPQDPENPECAYGYKEGAGGAVYMRNGVLHVVDCAFYDNEAAPLGPDVGGGAIYVVGVPELVVVGSRFVGNTGSNAGAIGLLWAGRVQIANSLFEGNRALGEGANSVVAGCPRFNHDEQGGAGGNGGAIAFDGPNDEDSVVTLCGVVFRDNRANELAGAFFRTPNRGQRRMHIEACLFEGNTARLGGDTFLMQNDVTVRRSTFARSRAGVNVAGEMVRGTHGGLWVFRGALDVENSTFYDHRPLGLTLERGNGALRNVTFVDSAVRGTFRSRNGLFVRTACRDRLEGANDVQWPEGEPCTTDVTFGDPRLGELADNGGPTPTCLPAPDGAAVGAGTDCPATDQRGEPRAADRCAAGAVEP